MLVGAPILLLDAAFDLRTQRKTVHLEIANSLAVPLILLVRLYERMISFGFIRISSVYLKCCICGARLSVA